MEWVGRALPLDARRNLTHSKHTKHMQVTLKSPTARPRTQGAPVRAMFRLSENHYMHALQITYTYGLSHCIDAVGNPRNPVHFDGYS